MLSIAPTPEGVRRSGGPSSLIRTSLGFVGVAILLGVFGDFEIVSLDPWA